MRRGAIVWIIVVGIAVGIAVTLVAILVPWLPAQASEERERIDFTLWFVTAICISIFALVAAVILYSVVKFRVRPDDDTDGPPIHGHTGLEIAWTAVPAILVTAISIVSAVVLYQNDNAGPNPLRVQVEGQQFAWRFTYLVEENLKTTSLALPVDRAVRFRLTGLDVIHSFWVPEFGQKTDAVPGAYTRLVVTPTKEGKYPIVCTELCGLGHATMRSEAHVMSQDEFDAWVRRQREAAAGAGQQQGGGEAAALFNQQGCSGCHAFQPAGSTAKICPDLDRVDASARRAGKPLDEYLRESIVQPDAYITPGFRAGVMPAFEQLNDEQLDALVQYLARDGEGS